MTTVKWNGTLRLEWLEYSPICTAPVFVIPTWTRYKQIKQIIGIVYFVLYIDRINCVAKLSAAKQETDEIESDETRIR